jgi:uncharacterized protein (DUF433 family)
MAAKTAALSDRFWSKVARRSPADCWEWQASFSNAAGYGQFWLNGTQVRAHRLAYQMERGPIPEGLVVRHRCDNPSCVNPAHLELGTHKDNSADRVNRGRSNSPIGERHGHCKLTEQQVLEIRASAEPQHVLAERYGVAQTRISAILRGASWSHLPAARKRVDCRRRLTVEQIREIYLAAGTCDEIAARYPCSRSMVSLIKLRKNHAEVTADL